MVTLRPYQQQAIDGLRNAVKLGMRRPMLVAPTGCHAPGQQIRMFDGSAKKVEDVAVGDLLMGMDSTPRAVHCLIRGRGQMMRIVPIKGDPWVVTADHVLSLRCNAGATIGRIKDISVREYLKETPYWRWTHKQFKVPVEYASSGHLPIEPYFMGVLLGDGTIRSSVGVSKEDPEIIAEVHRQAEIWGMYVRKDEKASSSTYFLSNGSRGEYHTNGLIRALQSIGLHRTECGSKFIPEQYLVALAADRWQLLAGLLDTDGSLSNKGYDFISKSKMLADGITTLARSLGLAAYMTMAEKFCQNGGGGTYYRVSISGHTNLVPCRIPRKIATPRTINKNPLHVGFRIEEDDPRGEYCGFTLDGDQRYLLDDFTVTHNSGKTVIAASLIYHAQQKGSQILFVAHRRELIAQTSRKLDDIGADHGIIQAGNTRTNDLPIQVASVQTMNRRQSWFTPTIIVADECHHLVSDSWQKIVNEFPSAVVIGLTATPCRTDGKGLGTFFNAIVECPGISELTRMGFLVPAVTYSQKPPNLRGVHRVAGDYNNEELAAVMNERKLVGNVVDEWTRRCRGRQTIVFAVNIEHSLAITKQFNDAGIPCEHVDGTTPNEIRDGVFSRALVVSNVGVYTEGTDVPHVSCIIIARPTMSVGLYIQMAGRGLRPSPGKTNCIILDHGGCALMHGLVGQDRVWTLTNYAGIASPKGPIIDVRDTIKVCPKCLFVVERTEKKCECGYVFSAASLKSVSGELTEAKAVRIPTEDEKRKAYQRALWIQRTQKKKDGTPYSPLFAKMRFKAMYGTWPPREWDRM